MTAIQDGWKLSIPAGPASQYRLAQLDDHSGLRRADYPCHAPLKMQLEARVSAQGLPGTWGFGVWNDPYGFTFAASAGIFRLPALPNAAWFFNSSPMCYLTFRDDRPGNGFLAQAFESAGFRPAVLGAMAVLPFSRKRSRALLRRAIEDDSVQLSNSPALSPRGGSAFEPTEWHQYALEWTTSGTSFAADGQQVLHTAVTPRSSLGIVIWIDNQHAAFTPEGKLTFGLEESPGAAWLEIRNLRVEG
ncbi:MAG TPA: hypothetical protein VMJ64_13675 [Anaerolineales bacterium]|nr:hypothetical protein [Anaerolineales bacterium]